MNYLDATIHGIHHPKVYLRRFDFDFEGMSEKASRVASALIPFLSLYAPIGSSLNVAMGSLRVVTQFGQAIECEKEGKSKKMALHLLKCAIAAASVATVFFASQLAMALITAADSFEGVARSSRYLFNKEFKKAAEEAIKTLSTLLYLGFMVCGGLELLALSLLTQTLISFYEARGEFQRGRCIEGASKFALGLLRLGKTQGALLSIQRRNELLRDEKYASLIASIRRGRAARGMVSHPLNRLSKKIDAGEQTLEDGAGTSYSLGAWFSGYGASMVKGQNIVFRKVEEGGKEWIEFEFKANHLHREKIENTLNELRRFKSKEVNEILETFDSHATSMTFKNLYQAFGDESAKFLEFSLGGMGSITVGNDHDFPNFYDRVTLRMESSKTIYDLHEMVAFLNMDEALRLSTHDEIDRLKIGYLFHIFAPRESVDFERSEEFFDLSLDELKSKIIELAPDMEKRLDRYLETTVAEELWPGCVRYRVVGLADEMREAGALGLTAAIFGEGEDSELIQRAVSILKMGFLSTEMRARLKMQEEGLSPSVDMWAGGSDSVFTQMITKGEFFSYYQSDLRVVIDLEAIEYGTYQYPFGTAGMRRMDDWWWHDFGYKTRLNPFELIEKATGNGGHEVMSKERICPTLFRGILVRTESARNQLIKELEIAGLIERDSLGREMINGIEKNQFIRVSEGDQVHQFFEHQPLRSFEARQKPAS